MATQGFREWLVARERDIALDIEDFGALREEFENVHGRAPRDGGTVDVPGVKAVVDPGPAVVGLSEGGAI